MWPDNETDLDFLNFTGVADTVAEIIVQAQPSPMPETILTSNAMTRICGRTPFMRPG
jgi:hypothetical protein